MQFSGDIGSDYVLHADFGRLDLAGFEELGHGATLLFADGFIFLLNHAEARD